MKAFLGVIGPGGHWTETSRQKRKIWDKKHEGNLNNLNLKEDDALDRDQRRLGIKRQT